MGLSRIWLFLVLISLLFAVWNHRVDLLTEAALSGASDAFRLAFEMGGPLCLWSGVMEVLRRTGLADDLARLFRPVLGRLFPKAGRDPETLSAVSANVSANLLGLGNAATPLGIRAARRMAAGCGGTASDELCRLVVLNTASVQLVPATAAALRASCGCRTPFDILPAVWLASGVSVCTGLLAARGFETLERARGKRVRAGRAERNRAWAGRSGTVHGGAVRVRETIQSRGEGGV